MRATLAGCALATLTGCSTPAPSVPAPAWSLEASPGAARDACARYRDLDDAVWGYCLTAQAVGMPDPAALAELCDSSGAATNACRTAWVDARIDDWRVPADVLLDGCGDAQDCAFRVLDLRARGDIDSQVADCERLVPRFASDCVAHALARWIDDGPTAEEAARMAAAPTRHEVRVGAALGRLVACHGVGECAEGGGRRDIACRRQRDELVRARWMCQK